MTAPEPGDRQFQRGSRGAILMIALGVGVASVSLSFWVPFVPLYLRELGARSDSDALGWAGLAFAGLGISRLVVAPVWGVLADRFGRRAMFVRALVFASATTLIAAGATEPWHIVLAFTTQGLFSGFVPAAAALTSVLAAESKMGQSLGLVNAAQYLGTTIGPVLGAVFATLFGLRGAIVVGAAMPALAAAVVVVMVPRDRIASRSSASSVASAAARSPVGAMVGVGRLSGAVQALADLTTTPVRFGLLLSFLQLAVAQAVRLALPLILAAMVTGPAAGVVGLAVATGGAASVAGVVVAGRYFTRPPLIVRSLALASLGSAAAFVVLAASSSAGVFIAGFALLSLVQGAMVPGTNTVIAMAVPRDRRGRVFGLVATAQALAFVLGPLAAVLLEAVSFQLGFAAMAIVFVAVSGLVDWKLREPVPVKD